VADKPPQKAGFIGAFAPVLAPFGAFLACGLVRHKKAPRRHSLHHKQAPKGQALHNKHADGFARSPACGTPLIAGAYGAIHAVEQNYNKISSLYAQKCSI